LGENNINMSAKHLQVKVQYFQDGTPENIPCREENFIRREIFFSLPIDQTALILVDLWNLHHIESWLDRANIITQKIISPVAEKARDAGITIVHAPSPEVIQNQKYNIYQGYTVLTQKDSKWPPEKFKLRKDEYKVFENPREQPPGLDFRWKKLKPKLGMSPYIKIHKEDFVVATGQQLQDLCEEKKLLHLIYAGFATNWCILHRDYGIIQMSERGYNCMLIKDATEGIEFPDTLEQKWTTELAIREVEQRYGFTLLSRDFTCACDVAETDRRSSKNSKLL